MGHLFIVRTNQRSLKYLLEQRKDNSAADALPKRAKSVEYKALSVTSVYCWDKLLKDLERDAELDPLWKKVLEEDGSCTWYTMDDGLLLYKNSKATAFKILYGRDPPKIIPYETSSAPTFEVDKYLEERDRVLDDLRKNLLKAQQIMKAWSDSHQRDVQFLVGDMVFLKLRP
ncbi:hypothetical protein Tco_1473671 [Tanacetum coccineum]